jgi:hypothetical protein
VSEYDPSLAGDPIVPPEHAFPPAAFGPPGPPGPVPPPPPRWSGTPVRPPAVVWLVPVAALLAVLGAARPWFRPQASFAGRSQQFAEFYSWRDGRIGLAAPILLVALTVATLNLVRGAGRFGSAADPVRTAGKFAVAAGVACALSVAAAWIFVPWQYHLRIAGVSYSWHALGKLGVSVARAPQAGFYLTCASAALAVVTGVVLLLTAGPAPRPGGAVPPPPPAYWQDGGP